MDVVESEVQSFMKPVTCTGTAENEGQFLRNCAVEGEIWGSRALVDRHFLCFQTLDCLLNLEPSRQNNKSSCKRLNKGLLDFAVPAPRPQDPLSGWSSNNNSRIQKRGDASWMSEHSVIFKVLWGSGDAAVSGEGSLKGPCGFWTLFNGAAERFPDAFLSVVNPGWTNCFPFYAAALQQRVVLFTVHGTRLRHYHITWLPFFFI